MPAKSVQARTPLYAPQEERRIPGVAESILRAVGVGGQASAAAALPQFPPGSGADEIIDMASRGLYGGKRLSGDEYLKVMMPERRVGPASGSAIKMLAAEQAVERTAQRAADEAATRRALDVISRKPSPPAVSARSLAGLGKSNLATLALTGAMGPLSQLAGRAYAQAAPNPTAQTRPRITPGGSTQPEGSMFRDEAVRTQGDVEMLLSEVARERERRAAADRISDIEQAMEIERYLREGAPYVAVAEDFEPLVISP